jgi:restriction endonuclease S subunit
MAPKMAKDHKLFKFSSVFDFERGRRLVELDQIEGEVAYISSTKNNNGIASHISPPEFMKIYTNRMTLSNSGSVGYLFYHDYKFVASDHCTVIWIKDKNVVLTNHIFSYLKPVIEYMRDRYNFGRELKNTRLAKERVLLPIDASGEPDWEYMESYTASLLPDISFESLETDLSLPGEIDINKWKEFSINDVFSEITPGKVNNAALLQDGTDIPYIGAKKKDSGVVRMVADTDDTSIGPCIAFICDGDGSVGYTNYVPFDRFLCTVNVRLGYNSSITHESALFLVTVLDLQRQKYSFGRKWGSRLDKTVIKLPVDSNKQPDWKFMEDYIKNTPYSEYIR